MRALVLLMTVLATAGAADAHVDPLTADDLQNLSTLARTSLAQLTPAQMQVVAVAIQHAEDQMRYLRSQLPPPVAQKVKKP